MLAWVIKLIKRRGMAILILSSPVGVWVCSSPLLDRGLADIIDSSLIFLGVGASAQRFFISKVLYPILTVYTINEYTVNHKYWLSF